MAKVKGATPAAKSDKLKAEIKETVSVKVLVPIAGAGYTYGVNQIVDMDKQQALRYEQSKPPVVEIKG